MIHTWFHQCRQLRELSQHIVGSFVKSLRIFHPYSIVLGDSVICEQRENGINYRKFIMRYILCVGVARVNYNCVSSCWVICCVESGLCFVVFWIFLILFFSGFLVSTTCSIFDSLYPLVGCRTRIYIECRRLSQIDVREVWIASYIRKILCHCNTQIKSVPNSPHVGMGCNGEGHSNK